MKSKRLKKISYTVFFFILFIGSSFYFIMKKEPLLISTCYSIFKIKLHDETFASEGGYLLNFIFDKNNDKKFSLVMNGNLRLNEKNYNIARKYIFNYEIQGGYFFSKVESVFIDPADQVGEKNNMYKIPKLNQTYVFKIVRLDNNRYLFMENLAPIFICTSK
ncbi:hypothetical protein [Providencia sp. PROV129]|uniref:hypothetical protein n=1 Tax=Providencia sp. PROV129 TaxID=2949839 RepID=UPI00234B6B8C|nr:hypothetical protein [Providencia sp. PROV129]